MMDGSREVEERAWFLGISLVCVGLSLYTRIDFTDEEFERRCASELVDYRAGTRSVWPIVGAGLGHLAARFSDHVGVDSADLSASESVRADGVDSVDDSVTDDIGYVFE